MRKHIKRIAYTTTPNIDIHTHKIIVSVNLHSKKKYIFFAVSNHFVCFSFSKKTAVFFCTNSSVKLQLPRLGCFGREAMDDVGPVTNDVGQENSPGRSSCATTPMVQPPAPKQKVEAGCCLEELRLSGAGILGDIIPG